MVHNAVQLFVCFVAGIALSVIIPIVTVWIRQSTKFRIEQSEMKRSMLLYFKFGVGSLVIGMFLLVIYLAGGGDPHPQWPVAVLYGYTWDATIQKVGTAITPSSFE